MNDPPLAAKGRNESSKASLASCKWASPRLMVHAPLLRVGEDRPFRLLQQMLLLPP